MISPERGIVFLFQESRRFKHASVERLLSEVRELRRPRRLPSSPRRNVAQRRVGSPLASIPAITVDVTDAQPDFAKERDSASTRRTSSSRASEAEAEVAEGAAISFSTTPPLIGLFSVDRG